MEKLIGSLKSKTQWFGLVLIVLGALQQNMDTVTAVIGEGNVGVFTSVVGSIVMFLRFITTKPLNEK